MASPVLHIKDSYYFEVPKSLWPANYESIEEVPQFLRDAHPHASLEEINHDLSGKILIPQPFGALEDLYTPASGVTISRFMIVETVLAILIFSAFAMLVKKTEGGKAPSGRFANLLESFVVYVRDNLARPSIGHGADKFVPYLLTVFFFILTCNLAGMIPPLGTVTGAIEVTAGLALCTFLVGAYSGIQQFGFLGYILNFIPGMDLPGPLAVILKPMIFAIEILGTVIKHSVLAIRLFANMIAGHMVLTGILGGIVTAAAQGSGAWMTAGFFGVVGATLFSCLELLVAFIQAYVFTMLSALFIGASIHHH